MTYPYFCHDQAEFSGSWLETLAKVERSKSVFTSHYENRTHLGCVPLDVRNALGITSFLLFIK